MPKPFIVEIESQLQYMHVLGFKRLFLALAGSVVSGALSLVGVTGGAAGVEGVGAAGSVLSGALGLVGVAGGAASVELVLALGVGGGHGEGSEGQGEDSSHADHFGGFGKVFFFFWRK